MIANLTRGLGFIDIVYFFLVIIIPMASGNLSIIGSFEESIEAGRSFGVPFLPILSLVGLILMMSTAISGILLLFLNRFGIYGALVQMPFKIFLLIPPTFYFLTTFFAALDLPAAIGIMVIVGLEAAKGYILILCLKTITSK